MKIIIDSNILFSALRGSNSKTRTRILTSQDEYLTPNFIITEIFKHKERIIKGSSTNEDETLSFLSQLLTRITFVNELSISISSWVRAFELCKSVDQDDTPFVALAEELEYPLWTRDERLKKELKRKGFNRFYDETKD